VFFYNDFNNKKKSLFLQAHIHNRNMFQHTVFIIGAGAQGRVTQDIYKENKDFSDIKFIDENKTLWGTFINGTEVLGGIDVIRNIKSPNIHIAIAHPLVKKKLIFEINKTHKPIYVNAIHKNAQISQSCEIGLGNFIGPNAIVNTGAKIGSFCIVNTGVIIEHDTSVGNYSSISPAVCVGARVNIEEACFIGMNATIHARVTIGTLSIIGMGSLIMSDVEKEHLYYGAPAKKIKKIDNTFNWKKAL